MPESTLNLTKSDLEAEAGDFLGWGRGADFSDTAFTARQQRDLDAIIKGALRSFYFPAPLPGESTSYDWSFMRPTRQVTFPSAASTIDLPDDFGGLEGTVRLVGSTTRPVEIPVVTDAMVARQFSETPDQTGTPLMCAIRPLRATTQTKGPRHQLYVFPTADQDYTFEYRYYFLPDALIASFPYPQGGTMHAETIRAAVKAAAELHKDNQPGPMAAYYVDRMKASVALDRRQKPQVYGIVTDPGYNADRNGYPGWRHYEQQNVVTYGGVSPG